MKTFKQFLIESSTFNIEQFKQDCAPVLAHLKGTGGELIMYRGEGAVPKDWQIREWRERPRPAQTPKEVHDSINQYFTHRSDIEEPIRSWMFCTGSKMTADLYTSWHRVPLAIFPIGEFQWVCAKDPDIGKDFTDYYFTTYREILKSQPQIVQMKQLQDKTLEAITHQLDSTEFWNSTDLQACLKSGNEIMFKCERFYAFSTFYDDPKLVWNSPEFKELLKSL